MLLPGADDSRAVGETLRFVGKVSGAVLVSTDSEFVRPMSAG